MSPTDQASSRADPAAPAADKPAPRPGRTRTVAVPEVRWATAATALFSAGALAQLAGAPDGLWWALYLACYVTGGWRPGLAGLRAAREKTLDIDLLMIAAALGAAAIGHILDGALLVVIFAVSGALEALATRRTADSVRGLLDLAPDRAHRLCPDGTEESVDTARLAVDDVIVVRPGECIGADGEVLDGHSDVDRSSITGEPLPVPASAGDGVFAGTLNGAGTLRVRVSQDPSASVLARIVTLVEDASATKAKAQLFIERIEQRYSVAVVAATLALFFGPLAFGADLQPTLLRAMTFMIVASPCAVVLSTMPPLLSSIANAGRHGVLAKSAVVMEKLGATTTVAFDKTGTLTEGTPRVTGVEVLAGGGLDTHELLGLAAAAEYPSEHPLGRAVVAAATERGITIPPVTDFEARPGLGVHARVGTRRIQVGSPAALLAGCDGTARERARAGVARLEATGATVVLVVVDGVPAGVFGLGDRLRPLARQTVHDLAALTGTTPVLLTGDTHTAARTVADEVGIGEVHAGLLPQDKVALVRQREARGERVLVVGDGVNDAPALAAASCGVAMGRVGADLTLTTADAVVVRDELATVPAVLRLSRRARRFVIANLAIAGSFIVALVTWPLVGHLPLPVAVAFHEGSTVLVALNGLRLLREAAWRA
ncbi:ATPase, P-type (transporting), HAD superfamily, subfamily IC/heavy metal translocating P-type ATPase [Haloechinothrix alba]|uniref:ATPase, P-type (Transporting), HAD superfamily, subfamily IC/heavy metal translocating P-type ATPase n=1 Tax=Haloechinothrix alba TaxID=664784 RepID=A0A238WRB1_9PSEU|nr:ATPase, P-type (transporting), HAD superfamily, subfamily IC/heavy metal translocating P-type ATPase [Haloechinothrix alba]